MIVAIVFLISLVLISSICHLLMRTKFWLATVVTTILFSLPAPLYLALSDHSYFKIVSESGSQIKGNMALLIINAGVALISFMATILIGLAINKINTK